MSFSSNVKREIGRHFSNTRHCDISELSALLTLCGEILKFQDKICLKIQLENFVIVKKCFTLLQNTFNINVNVSVRSFKNRNKTRIYTLLSRDTKDTIRILQAVGMIQEKQLFLNYHIPALVVQSTCCKRAYIRGIFLMAGSITDPFKNYHLEFVLAEENFAISLQNLIHTFELETKVIKRKEHFILYLKEGEKIVDLLNIMEAHVALMEFENIRILKEMRNDINRKVNCETANLNKIVSASVKQVEDILYIKNTVGLVYLEKPLQDIAIKRLKYPDISLKELGETLEEPLGKSGVNHRLKKIGMIVENLKKGRSESL